MNRCLIDMEERSPRFPSGTFQHFGHMATTASADLRSAARPTPASGAPGSVVTLFFKNLQTALCGDFPAGWGVCSRPVSKLPEEFRQ